MNRRTLALLLVAPALAAAAGCAYQDPMSRRGGDVYGSQRAPGYYGYGNPYPPGGYYYDPRYGYYTSSRSYPYGYGYYPYGYSPPPVNYCRDADRDGRCDSYTGGGGGSVGGGDAGPPPPRNPTLRDVREEFRRRVDAAQPPAQPQAPPSQQHQQQAAPAERTRAQAEPPSRPVVRRGEGRVRPVEVPQSNEP